MQVKWKEYHRLDIQRQRHDEIVQKIKESEYQIIDVLKEEFKYERLPRCEFHKLVNHFSRALQNHTSDSISLHWAIDRVTVVDEQVIINLALPRFLKFCDEWHDSYVQLWEGNFILQDIIKEHIQAPYDIQRRFFTRELRENFYKQILRARPNITFTQEEFVTV